VAYVFNLRFDLDVRVYADNEVLDRPAHARIARRRFAPRGRLVRHPRILTRVLQRRRRAFLHVIVVVVAPTGNKMVVIVLDLASRPGKREREKGDAPATRPVDMPPVSVGRPAAADGHATGVVLVGFSVVLIG
jgi:hypothetical protein